MLLSTSILLLLQMVAHASSDKEKHDNSTVTLSKRNKRQYISNCPQSCFSCSPAASCQSMLPQFTCTGSCCCPAAKTLTGACDGDDAVAACLNNLCGQGFFCTRSNYCCRCPVGKSIGNCVNGKCPVGYSCNTNNYCCAVGMIGVAGECVNGQCPSGYKCGDGNLCYSNSDGTDNANAQGFNGTSNSITRLSAHPKPADLSSHLRPATDPRPRTIDVNTGRFMLGPANNFYNGNLNNLPQGMGIASQNLGANSMPQGLGIVNVAGNGLSGFQGAANINQAVPNQLVPNYSTNQGFGQNGNYPDIFAAINPQNAILTPQTSMNIIPGLNLNNVVPQILALSNMPNSNGFGTQQDTNVNSPWASRNGKKKT